MASVATSDLCWRVERACGAAWPALHRDEHGGWVVGRSGGGTRRINSASAASADARLDPPTLAAIEQAYAADGQPAIFRVTDLTPDATALLDAAGYRAAEGSVRTLFRPAGAALIGDGGVLLTERPDVAWLAARRRISLAVGAGVDDHAAPALRVVAPARFARIDSGGMPCCVGFVALVEEVAVIEAVATAPDSRRRGHAAALVAALLDWAGRAGAIGVALQVEEANVAARSLYARLGFAADLYGYYYRHRAPSRFADAVASFAGLDKAGCGG